MEEYHDSEWGVPVHDDKKIFEFMVLDGAQAGLSWQTVLNKREGYRRLFADFDVERVAAFTDADCERILVDPAIIRNRLKVYGAVISAREFIKVQDEFGTFDKYIWQFTGGITIDHKIQEAHQVPATSPESDAMSKDLRKRGFKFVGSTICYAFMQAAGMINDHVVTCHRYPVLAGLRSG